MAFDPRQVKEILSALESTLTNSSSIRSRPSAQRGDSSGGEDFDKVFKKVGGQAKKLADALEDVLTSTEDNSDALKKANDALAHSTASFGDLDHELDNLYKKTIPEAREYMQKHSEATKNLTSELAKTIRAQSLFGASLLESHNEVQHGTIEYTKMIGNMRSAADGLSKGLLRQAHVWDEASDSITKNLTPTDFARLHAVLGEAQVVVTESLGGMEGINKLNKLNGASQKEFIEATSANTEAGKKLQAGIMAAVLELDRMGQALEIATPGGGTEQISLHNDNGEIDPAKVSALQGDYVKLAQVVETITRTYGKNNEAMGKFADIAEKSNSMFSNWSHHLGEAIDDFTGLSGSAKFLKKGLLALADFELIKKALTMFKNGVKDTYSDLVKFNIANVPATFAHVKEASIAMGMSFDDTVKFMQENKNALALYGNNFDTLTGGMKATFQKFGYNMQQGAAIVGPSIDAAIGAGVDIKNGNALNNFVTDTMTSFRKISGVIDITAEQYAKMNATLLQSTEVQGNLLGLDQKSSLARGKEIIALRDQYAVQLGSIDAANELIRAQEAQKNESVKEQILNSAKLAQGAQMAGMSGQQSARLQHLFAIGVEGRAAQGPEAEKEFQGLMMQRQKGLAKRQSDANRTGNEGVIYSTEVGLQAVQLSGSAEASANAANTALMRGKAGAIASPAQQKAAADAAAGPEVIAKFSNEINSISTLFHDNLFKAVFGAIGSLGGLAIQSLLTARSLGKLGGGLSDFIPGGKFLNKIKGIGGKIFGGGAAAGEAGAAVEGTAATTAGGGLLAAAALPAAIATAVAAVGTAGYAAVQAARGKDASNWISNLDSHLVGGGIGGLIGKGLDLFGPKATTQVTHITPRVGASPAPGAHPPTPSAPGSGPDAGVNTTATAADDKKLDVQDPTAHNYLSTIADSMVQAVKLLQMMADNGNSTPAEVVAAQLQKKLPTATSYITGRQPATGT